MLLPLICPAHTAETDEADSGYEETHDNGDKKPNDNQDPEDIKPCIALSG